jgi:hypothetical protein
MWIIMSSIVLCHHHVVSCQVQVYHLWSVNYIICFEYLGSSLITTTPSWDVTQRSLYLVVKYRSLCLDTFLVTMDSCTKGLNTWWAMFSTCQPSCIQNSHGQNLAWCFQYLGDSFVTCHSTWSIVQGVVLLVLMASVLGWFLCYLLFNLVNFSKTFVTYIWVVLFVFMPIVFGDYFVTCYSTCKN